MRRYFKPTSHSHLLPSHLCTSRQPAPLPRLGGGLQRGAGSQITRPVLPEPFGAKSKPGWKGRCQGGGADGKDQRREEDDSRHRGEIPFSKEGMMSTSKTSTFDNNVPPGPHASPASLGAPCRTRAGGTPAALRWLAQRHVETWPEAPTGCTRSPSPSLALNHTVNTYIFTAEKESKHEPRAAAAAAQGQHAALNSAFVPALLFIPEAPSAPLLQTKSLWPPRTKTLSSLARPSRALAPAREGRWAPNEQNHGGCAQDALGGTDTSDPASGACGSAPGRSWWHLFPLGSPLPSPLLLWRWPPSQAG